MGDYRYSLVFSVGKSDLEETKSTILGFLFPQGEPLLTRHNGNDGDKRVFATFSSNHDYDIGKVALDLLPGSKQILGFYGFD